MVERINSLRGMEDLLPARAPLWLSLESKVKNLLERHGFLPLNTPLVEKMDLFIRSVGEFSDVVSKEMYHWKTPKGEHLCLRPEGTAGCARAVIEHDLARSGIQKTYYFGQMFRYERPQRGRLRQFHQIGAEIFGADNTKSDVELISLSANLWQRLRLSGLTLEVNTLGNFTERCVYEKELKAFFRKHSDKLDEASIKRVERNPLRILDSKIPEIQELCKTAPQLGDYISEKAENRFTDFCKKLTVLNIDFKINKNLVRGLDYYNDTVFEWTTTQLGAQNTICAGGRYDNLIENMGGTPTPAIGFAIGVERLLLLITSLECNIESKKSKIYIVANEAHSIPAIKLASAMRNALDKAIVYNDLSLKGFKSQLKMANKYGSDYTVIFGEEEWKKNMVILKPMQTQEPQITLTPEKLIALLNDRLSLG